MKKNLKKNKIPKKRKASALIVTMMILGIILIVGLSMALVSVRERRASIGEGRSNLTYQYAETGVEKVMAAVVSTEKNGGTKTGHISWENFGLECFSGNKKLRSSSAPYLFEAELQDENGDNMQCKGGNAILDIKFIKSIGLGSSQERAIQAAVSHGP